MQHAIVAGIVALLVSATSATAAFVVTSAQIKNGTIQTVDMSAAAKRALKGQRGPRGLTGVQGSPGVTGVQGPAGAQGPPGIESLMKVVVSTEVPPETYDSITADCPAGQKAISGGVVFPGGGTEIWEDQLKVVGGNGWSVTGANFNPTETFTLYAIALCSPNVRVTAGAAAAMSQSQKAEVARAAQEAMLTRSNALRPLRGHQLRPPGRIPKT